MPATWADDIHSAEDSDIRYLLVFRFPYVIYRLALADLDIVYQGQTYYATAGELEDLHSMTPSSSHDFSIRLSRAHPVVQKYQNHGLPTSWLSVEVYSYQYRSGQARLEFEGDVMGEAIQGNVASFRCEDELVMAMNRRMPARTSSRHCPHMLYDAGCRVDREEFKVTATIVSRNGDIVRLSTIDGKPDHWADYGYVERADTGEAFYVLSQEGVYVTMQFPFDQLSANTEVYLYAGCDQTIQTCQTKFDNVRNYGGQPYMPYDNYHPRTPDGYGIISVT